MTIIYCDICKEKINDIESYKLTFSKDQKKLFDFDTCKKCYNRMWKMYSNNRDLTKLKVRYL